MAIKTINLETLSMDELLIYRLIKGKEKVYAGTFTNNGMAVRYVRFILQNTFGVELVRQGSGYNIEGSFITEEDMAKQVIRHPCMVKVSEITDCGHVRQCYLSYKCPAAKDVLPDSKLLQLGGQVLVNDLHPHRI